MNKKDMLFLVGKMEDILSEIKSKKEEEQASCIGDNIEKLRKYYTAITEDKNRYIIWYTDTIFAILENMILESKYGVKPKFRKNDWASIWDALSFIRWTINEEPDFDDDWG